jgi:hypothetical protein
VNDTICKNKTKTKTKIKQKQKQKRIKFYTIKPYFYDQIMINKYFLIEFMKILWNVNMKSKNEKDKLVKISV